MDRARLAWLNDRPPAEDGRYVLYWMQAAQRAAGNLALEHAIGLADARGQPVLVGFGLMDDYPEANLRHYTFMLEGLRETATALRRRGIPFVLRHGPPAAVALALAGQASLVVCDKGYLRHQRAWRQELAERAGCQVIEVEGEVVVPVVLASDKAEIGARTLRPKLLRLRERFLEPLPERKPRQDGLDLDVRGDLDPDDIAGCLAALRLDRSVGPVTRFKGGTREARARLDRFLDQRLAGYHDGRNDPARQQTAELSAYLQFGQISPVEIALRTIEAAAPGDANRTSFLEELIVRRELAHNHVTYRPDYDQPSCLPDWAKRTLARHAADPRPYLYGLDELAEGATHDPYFNAAMREMRVTGYMHNYMRMYWGKKILEWSPDPETAFAHALQLNNRYFLCGRGPNAMTNVGWLLGLHDRPWVERPIFGQVRYMNARGLERKFAIADYVAWCERLD